MLILQDPFIALSLSALLGVLLGLIVSRVSENGAGLKKELEEERQKTFEKEKEISGEIYESLYELHHGLVKTVKSYDMAVKTVLDKLPTPVEKIQELGLQANVPPAINLDGLEVVTKAAGLAEVASLVDAEFSPEAHDLAESKKAEAESRKLAAEVKARVEDEPQLGSVSGDDWSQPIANR